MTAAPVSDLERKRIVKLLESGKSQHAVAEETRRSKATINAIAKAFGKTGERSASTEKAVAARRDYALAERLTLINEATDKARSLLGPIEKPAEMWQISTAIKTLVELRRLEDGEATSRSEVETSERGNRIAGRLDELAARRRARDVVVESHAG